MPRDGIGSGGHAVKPDEAGLAQATHSATGRSAFSELRLN
jgi:hypothetical protein